MVSKSKAATGTSKKKNLTSALDALAEDPEQLASAHGTQLLHEVLESSDAGAIRDAAKLIEAHGLAELEPALSACYRALATDRAHADADCVAKEALLAALDAIGSNEAELFAGAARYEQRLKIKGSLRDTAGRVRARGMLGLARLGHPDAMTLFGAGLADSEPQVRLSAARAVAHRGERHGAGLLLLRLGVGDSEGEIEVECLRGLFVLAPEWAMTRARTLLEAGPREREHALSALGTALCDEAVELLEQALASTTLANDREQVIDALGLSLRPRARTFLLSLLEGDRSSDALAALRVLAFHRYDARLAEQVFAATAHSRELARRAQEAFARA